MSSSSSRVKASGFNASTRSRNHDISAMRGGASRMAREPADQRTAAAASSRERRRRERAKSRAGKMFARQFSADASASQQKGDSPRPALYKGQMGSSHRRSAHMQKAAANASASASSGASGAFPWTFVSARALKVATAALCLVLTCLFLYAPAQQCYQAQREHDRLSAERSMIEQRNGALDSQNDALASDAGMEDAVRQKYGYVKAGEQTAVVTGLSDETVDTARSSEGIEANVLSSSVKAPEEWYTPLLDAFFGVE